MPTTRLPPTIGSLGGALLDGYSYPTPRSRALAAVARLRSPLRLARAALRRATRLAGSEPQPPRSTTKMPSCPGGRVEHVSRPTFSDDGSRRRAPVRLHRRMGQRLPLSGADAGRVPARTVWRAPIREAHPRGRTPLVHARGATLTARRPGEWLKRALPDDRTPSPWGPRQLRIQLDARRAATRGDRASDLLMGHTAWPTLLRFGRRCTGRPER